MGRQAGDQEPQEAEPDDGEQGDAAEGNGTRSFAARSLAVIVSIFHLPSVTQAFAKRQLETCHSGRAPGWPFVVPDKASKYVVRLALLKGSGDWADVRVDLLRGWGGSLRHYGSRQPVEQRVRDGMPA